MDSTHRVHTMTVAVTKSVFLEKQKVCRNFTNMGNEKLETIIYKIELHLKLASLKSPFMCPFKTWRQGQSAVQVIRAASFLESQLSSFTLGHSPNVFRQNTCFTFRKTRLTRPSCLAK